MLDLTHAPAAELDAAADYLRALAALRRGTLAPADAPDAGTLPAIDPQWVGTAAAERYVPPPTPTLDATGLPWDARIHSAGAILNSDGTWRQRRGLSDMTYKAQIETELRAGSATATAVPPAPPLPTPPVAEATPAVPTPPAPPATPASLADLMGLLTPHMVAGKVTMPDIVAACAGAGLGSLSDLGSRADLVPVVWAALNV